MVKLHNEKLIELFPHLFETWIKRKFDDLAELHIPVKRFILLLEIVPKYWFENI